MSEYIVGTDLNKWYIYKAVDGPWVVHPPRQLWDDPSKEVHFPTGAQAHQAFASCDIRAGYPDLAFPSTERHDHE
jgi:hypothetical protein